jgi:hypothetical protein
MGFRDDPRQGCEAKTYGKERYFIHFYLSCRSLFLCSFSNCWPKSHRSPSNSISLVFSASLVSTYFQTLGFGTSDDLVRSSEDTSSS